MGKLKILANTKLEVVKIFVRVVKDKEEAPCWLEIWEMSFNNCEVTTVYLHL